MNLGEPGKGTKHLKLGTGLLIATIGAVVLANSVNLLPFNLGIDSTILLQATSLGSLVGGLHLLWSGLKKPLY